MRFISFLYLARVLTDTRRIDGTVARITFLKTVSDVNIRTFATLGNGESAGPSEGLNYVNGVGSGLSSIITSCSIELAIAYYL